MQKRILAWVAIAGFFFLILDIAFLKIGEEIAIIIYILIIAYFFFSKSSNNKE